MQKFICTLKCFLAGVAPALWCITLSGCFSSSPAPRYYTLDMTASAGEPALRHEMVVERLETAGSLDRRNILIKTSGTEAEYYARDQWLSDVGELVSNKLNMELNGGDTNSPCIAISGTILCFEQVDKPDGTAEAHIKLQLSFFALQEGSRNGRLCSRMYEVSEKADEASASSVVRSLSRGLERIAEEIMKTNLEIGTDADNG